MSKIAGEINHHMMRNAKTRAINAPALDLIADILEQHTAGILAGVKEHMDKRKSEARSAGFDAADMATAAAHGFRYGVAKEQQAGWVSATDKHNLAPCDVVILWVHAEMHGEDDDGNHFAEDVSGVHIGEWRVTEHGSFFDCYSSPFADQEGVTHWMPLPPAPGPADGESNG